MGFNYFSFLSSLFPNDRTFLLSAFSQTICLFLCYLLITPSYFDTTPPKPNPFQTVLLSSKHFELGRDLKVRFLIEKLQCALNYCSFLCPLGWVPAWISLGRVMAVEGFGSSVRR